LPFDPVPRAQAKVGVQFAVDSDGILTVLARDVKKGSEKILKIETAVQVDDKKVEEMISQSVEHAFEDLEQRRWVELELKAKRILLATEKALAFVKEDLTQDEIDSIQAALINLKILLPTKDLFSVKQAVQELDQKTQDLANLVMQKMTMDQMN
jgi:molecular chaperone DnaK